MTDIKKNLTEKEKKYLYISLRNTNNDKKKLKKLANIFNTLKQFKFFK